MGVVTQMKWESLTMGLGFLKDVVPWYSHNDPG